MTASSTTIPGYELIRELGVGGMATVWLAIQRSLDRKVAIKVMKRNIDDLDKFERRFLQEGRTMAKLPHRNIVAVYDIVKGEDISYIAMEYLDGGTLSQKMKDGLSLAEAISVVVQIAAALQFAHEHGIVHRDLKPANIMFRDEATPVLTDFGIAKQQDQGATRLTQTGMLVGTPTYMSPEQINALEVDGRSDLYSLGVLFYELLTGAPPFQADTPIAVLMAHLTTPPPALPMQFADFQPVIDGMLAKGREERFQDMRAFTRSLKAAVVNNQNLWARLQADPNASSSEQLRALGFSISGPQSQRMQGLSSEQIRLPPSGQGSPRTPTPSGGFVPPPGYAQQPTAPSIAMPRSNKPLIVGGVAAGAAVLAVAIALALWPKPEIDEADKVIVDIALNAFRDDLAVKDYPGARENLLAALQKAPRYSKTREAVTQLAGAFRDAATTALAAGKFDEATVALENARSLAPDDPAVAKLDQDVTTARDTAAKRAEVQALMARADGAERVRQYVGPNGAYALLQQARQLLPQDAALKQKSDAMVARLLVPVREAVKKNDAAGAKAALDLLARDLANDPAFQSASQEVEAAATAAERRLRLAGMLARFDRQLAAGRLVEPAGDNARESLAAAQAIDAKDGEVQQRSIALTARLVQRAGGALESGDTEAALQAATDALALRPDDAAAAQLKRTIESRLDARRVQIIQGLAAARQAVAAQQFLPPALPNARAAIEAVLKADPGNAEAQALLADLPKRIAEAAGQRIANDDLAGAAALLAEARKVYGSDAELAALAQTVAQRTAAATAEAARNANLERIAQQIAARPLAPATVATAAREIAALMQANPRDVDAATLKQRLVDALAAELDAARAPGAVEVVAQAAAEAGKALPGDAGLRELDAAVTAVRTRVAAAESERLAAIAGRLVLNAYPWGTVESVVDAQGKAVALPADASTPVILTVPQGVYYVTFRHPQGGRRPREAAQVKAKETVVASTSFAGTVTAQGYLDRAGY